MHCGRGASEESIGAGEDRQKERREAEPKRACFSPFAVRFENVVRKLCVNLENGSRFPEKEKSQEPHDSWENPWVGVIKK